MSGLLSRFTTFVPNATILSNDHNQELNRIVNLLNGTTTNLKTVLKTSDAGDPPLELDQLSTGPIQKWFQGGVLKATLTNVGGLTLGGDLVLSAAAPLFRMADSSADNDSMRFDMTGSNLWRFVDENDGVASLFYTFGTRVFTFEQIPVGPAADPTTSNQLARKAYVDAKTVSFSVGFSIVDPSTANLNSHEFGSWPVPPGGTYTITQAKIFFREGSHTAGGSLVFVIDQAGVGNISSLGLNDTNNTVNTVYSDNFANFTAAENQIFSCFLSSRSGTITEKDVMVVLEGFRTLI